MRIMLNISLILVIFIYLFRYENNPNNITHKSISSDLKITMNGYKIYIPMITNRFYVEKNYPGCRWARNYGLEEISIFYKWGSNLQNPADPWRISFTSAVSDWNSTQTHIDFYFHVYSQVTINKYFASDGLAGYALPYCNGSVTSWYDVYGNSFYSPNDNVRHSITGHELGHSQSIGHLISNEIALMGNNPDPNFYFVPQPLDVLFVNQCYP